MLIDGALNTRTAFCADPYPDGSTGLLTVPQPELDASLLCTGNLGAPGPGPVFLVPGTGTNPPHDFGWNWEPALNKLGIPWCAVTLPNNALNDIQVAGEYV